VFLTSLSYFLFHILLFSSLHFPFSSVIFYSISLLFSLIVSLFRVSCLACGYRPTSNSEFAKFLSLRVCLERRRLQSDIDSHLYVHTTEVIQTTIPDTCNVSDVVDSELFDYKVRLFSPSRAMQKSTGFFCLYLLDVSENEQKEHILTYSSIYSRYFSSLNYMLTL
jgi:hypothetical protein